MKILFIVVGHFFPVSGVGRTSFALARYLAVENEVTVFACHRDRETSPEIKFYRVPFWQPNRIWEFIFPLPVIWNFLLGSYLSAKNRNKYDIVHVFNGLVCSRSSLITLQICQKGAFTYLTGNSLRNRTKKKSPKHLTILFLEWLIYRWHLFKELVVCSETEKSEIIHFYQTDSRKIAVLYNGIDKVQSPLPELRLSARRRLEYSEDDKVCLFVGYDLKRKGLEFVLHALALLPPEFKLLVVGGKDTRGYYQEVMEKEHISNRIQFMGQQRDMARFYAAADIFVLPTLYEPFGTVVFEAMSWGLPVVVSKNAGAAELITPGKEGYLINNPQNPEEIATLIRQIWKEGKTGFSEQALRTARKSTWKARASQLMEIYRETTIK